MRAPAGRAVAPGVFLLLALLAEPAGAQEAPGYVDWLNRRIDEAVAARVNQRGISKQVEAPSVAASSTTLVDHASFADVLGVSFNPPTFPRRDAGEPEASSQTFSLTPYAVLAAVLGGSPDDPFLYEDSRLWRSVAASVGFENEEVAGAGEGAGRTLVTGLKIKLWNPREVDPRDPRLGELRVQLGVAAGDVAALNRAIRDTLFHRLAGPLGMDTTSTSQEAAFITRLGDPAVFQAYLALLGEEGRRAVLDLVEGHVDAVVGLRRQARELVADLRGQPQLSLDVQSRSRERGADEVTVGLAFDLGLAPRLHWTLNGGARFVDGTESRAGGEGASVATQVAFQLRPATLVGPDPIALAVAVRGEVFDGRKPVWRLQGKLTIPLVEGISLPLTATWSNRSDLAEEDGLFGRLGLAVDTSRLLLAMGRR